jgi:hypothetical protein
MRRLIVFSLLVGSVACSSSPTPSAPAEGNPSAGNADIESTFPFLPPHISGVSAIAGMGVQDPAYPNQVSVLIATAPNFCPLAQSLIPVANLFEIIIVLGKTDVASTVLPGTYALGDSLQADFGIDDSACHITNGAAAFRGQVIVSSVAPSVVGTFDLTFGGPTQGRVLGTFNATFCNIPYPSIDAGVLAEGGVSCLPGGTVPP